MKKIMKNYIRDYPKMPTREDRLPEPKVGDLMVWWVTNPPHQGERYPVTSVDEAIKILHQLADRDLALGDVVDCNVGGLERFTESGWEEYYDDEDRDIDEIIEEKIK